MEILKQHLQLLERLLREISFKKNTESKKKILEPFILQELKNIRYFENIASLPYDEKKALILSRSEDGWLPENVQIESMSKILLVSESEEGKLEMIDGVRIGYAGIDPDNDITIYSTALKSKAPILYHILDSASPCIFWPVYEPVIAFDRYKRENVYTGTYKISYTYSRVEPRGPGNVSIEPFPSMKTYLESLIPKLDSASWRTLEFLTEERDAVVWDLLVELRNEGLIGPKVKTIPERIGDFLTKTEAAAFKIVRKQTKFLENSIEKLASDLEEIVTPLSGSLALFGIAGLLELPLSDLFIYLAHLEDIKIMLLKNPDMATQFSNIIKLGSQETPEKLRAALAASGVHYLPGLEDPSSYSWGFSSYVYFIGACMLTALIAYGVYWSVKTGQYPNNVTK